MAKINFKTMKKSTKEPLITIAVLLVFYVVMTVLGAAGALSSLMKGLLVPICTYSLVAIGLNLCVGYLGELSIGHAGFMCVGAFVGAFVTKLLQPSIGSDILLFIIALIAGTLVAALFGFLIGIPVLRLRGDYLAIVTLAFGEIIKNIINVIFIARDKDGMHFAFGTSKSLNLDDETASWLVNGPQGINKIPHLSSFTIGIVVIIITLLIVYNFVNSRTGRAVMAIRDNRIAAESVGLNITGYKLLAFTISAAIAGAGGVLYAHNLSSLTATSQNFGYNMSILILVFVVLGGIGSFPGSIIAAALLTFLPEALRGLSDYRMLIYAIVLIAVMIFTWSPKAKNFREKYSVKNLIKARKESKKEEN